ncbi:glutamate 5-kinase [Lederbergia wuyishanensis]|uniref:Glutamate 5-kinase n=1 Tax=Lederbergia wuyishanensis TaxID=1347903 RepID=A0ABU0D0E5_9BACI|nr:glutamate 5-kinase [Lederbergia wuyishanensis]MCJ8006485.1 glutamate 5-kinase [Lederbergia wuyishanensis]MDQ0341861.1 glutamate 5-kinase [Lederbergia wuyishanensis]
MRKQRIVVKIGSSSLTNDRGEIDQEKLNDHVQAVAKLRQARHEVILVSSGAVAAGFARLGYPSRPVTIKGRQAAAAVGQSVLIQSYIEKFSEYRIIPAQILLTRNDFSNRERYRNAFATIMELLERGILPIINENDTVSVEELTFGDNDMLSALVSGFIHADQLIILTDINGLYDSNPRQNPLAKKLDVLNEITEEMLEGTNEVGSKVGTGGMRSKLLAAKKATSLGVPVFIGKGQGPDKLQEILHGNGDGTYISSADFPPINTSRQWIAFHSESTGKIYVDQGAEEAILYNGKSLLPAGVFKIHGTFQKGDVVEVYGMNGLIGKGEVSYSSNELMMEIKRRNEEKRTEALAPSVEVIHRNRWVQV